MKPVTIVGGGLAGLTLGIGLRRAEIPATLWEAGTYPRHRVCGEFISGRGVEVLQSIELLEDCLQRGARWARSAAFFHHDQRMVHRVLPQPALCVSRYTLDALLADRFAKLGGTLRTDCRWTKDWQQEGLVQTTGRNRSPSSTHSWRWYGIKAHALGIKLEADLEMHFGKHGYIGLCQVEKETVNVCGLFRRRRGQERQEPSPQHLLQGEPGSILSERWRHGRVLDSSVRAVAGLDFRDYGSRPESGCKLGDAMAMIPPLTGNGMSIAMESASLAVEPLEEYSREILDWKTAVSLIASSSRRTFARRLKWAARMHELIFVPRARTLLMRLCARSGWLWNQAFLLTRS